MPRLVPARNRRSATLRVTLGLGLLAAVVTPAAAIEMFTFFGDGSRIGLPSLEVPIEAYPGIPLRSDRIRARRATRRQVVPAPAAQPGLPRGITIRTMPPAPQPQAAPRPRSMPAQSAPPPAPAPEDILVESVRAPLGE
jgi:hypothetical protein